MTHDVIVGLGFGDEAKGATVDWLCTTKDVKAVIRYNGGPQAAHNVVQPDGRHHEFAQFGSGTFHGVPTHLSEHMLVNPFNLMAEYEHLKTVGCEDALNNLTIAREALLVTPIHVAANRRREDQRGSLRHGSTGQGVGETRSYAIRFQGYAPRIGDMAVPGVMKVLLERLQEHYESEFGDLGDVPPVDELVDMYFRLSAVLRIVPRSYVNTLLDSGDCVFEGAQGVLLDESFGFHPHTTWTNTTAHNARALLDGRRARTIGLTRSYHTRHGAGPFPTENYETETLSLPELHNDTGIYQGSWRVGALDLTLLKYAVHVVGAVDTIGVSHMDYDTEHMMTTHGYRDWSSPTPFELETLRLPRDQAEQQYMTDFFTDRYVTPYQYDFVGDQDNIADAIQNVTGVRPTIFAWGPTYEDRAYVGVNLSDLTVV